jgi:hypothetical protein
VELEGLDQLKNPETSSEIKPMTLQLVAKCLNQLHYHVPPMETKMESLSFVVIQ